MRTLSSRCSMWNDTRLPRAPENNRTGMEINPKVKNPVQTEAAIRYPLVSIRFGCGGDSGVPHGGVTSRKRANVILFSQKAELLYARGGTCGPDPSQC